MKIIKSVEPLNDYFLLCEFDDGTKKKADIKPFLNSEVFEPLKDINLFHNIKTNGYTKQLI